MAQPPRASWCVLSVATWHESAPFEGTTAVQGARVVGVRRRSTALLAVIVATALAAATPAAGQPDHPQRPELAQGVPAAEGLPPDVVEGRISPRPDGARGPVPIFIELERTAAVDAYSAARQAGRSTSAARGAATAAKEATSRAADRVLRALLTRDAGAEELYRTVNAVPGLAVVAEPARVRELVAMPQVRSVSRIVPKTLTNSNAVQLSRTLATWQQTGRFGDGLRIGIIDDGIDYTHADFGGPGTPEAYDAIDRTRIDASYFPTAKVVGGHDLAGDDYDASGASGPAALTPQPDPNPLPCGDHGTHVAGTAAGFGVNADGGTFRGDYGALDGVALNRMRIGPGTAPKALLYAFKVFGCGGSTTLAGKAMDLALDPNTDGDCAPPGRARVRVSRTTRVRVSRCGCPCTRHRAPSPASQRPAGCASAEPTTRPC